MGENIYSYTTSKVQTVNKLQTNRINMKQGLNAVSSNLQEVDKFKKFFENFCLILIVCHYLRSNFNLCLTFIWSKSDKTEILFHQFSVLRLILSVFFTLNPNWTGALKHSTIHNLLVHIWIPSTSNQTVDCVVGRYHVKDKISLLEWTVRQPHNDGEQWSKWTVYVVGPPSDWLLVRRYD